MTTIKRKNSARDTLSAECGRVLGPDRGECLLPAGHRETWCADVKALNALEYLIKCAENFNVHEVRDLLKFCWALGCPSSRSNPNALSDDEVRREGWYLIWSGRC